MKNRDKLRITPTLDPSKNNSKIMHIDYRGRLNELIYAVERN